MCFGWSKKLQAHAVANVTSLPGSIPALCRRLSYSASLAKEEYVIDVSSPQTKDKLLAICIAWRCCVRQTGVEEGRFALAGASAIFLDTYGMMKQSAEACRGWGQLAVQSDGVAAPWDGVVAIADERGTQSSEHAQQAA